MKVILSLRFSYGNVRSLNDFSEVQDVKKLVKWTFCFEDNQLEELKELSKKSSVPQTVFVREALDYILKKYRYFLTMRKFNSEEARYLLAGSRDVDTEERPFLPSSASVPWNRKSKRSNHESAWKKI